MTDHADLTARLRRLPSPMCVHCDPNLPRWAADALDAANAENARLAQWKAEALVVLGAWDRVHEALGSPARLGESTALASLNEAERVGRERDEALAEVAQLRDALERSAPWLDYLAAHVAVDWSPSEEAVMRRDAEFIQSVLSPRRRPMPKEAPVADQTDRSSMDDLTAAVARAVFSADFTASDAEIAAMGPAALETYRAIAQQIIEAQQAHLRERGVLLGPDGLIKATHVCDGDWDDYGDEVQQSFPFACNWTDGAGEMVAGAPLFTLSPLDPPEDTP